MDFEQIFTIVCAITGISLVTFFYINGKKVLNIFPKIENVNVLFREKRVSGYSNKSWMTKMGGAQNILDIIITDTELWIKCPIIFAGVGEWYDGIHRLKMSQVQKVDLQSKDNLVVVTFKRNDGSLNSYALKFKKHSEFLKILRKLINSNE